MARILFSRPESDVTLGYLYFYSKELVKLSDALGHKTINKEQHNASKSIIISIIKKLKPKLIMFNGHGSPDCICGHKNETIIDNNNAEILADSITYTVSCSSASKLGVTAYKKGTRCFIGYLFDFALGKDSAFEASPKNDRIAKLFLEPSNLLFSSLLRGNTAKESIEKAKNKMKESINYLEHTTDFLYASHYAPFLFGNYLGLVSHGDDNAHV